MAGPPPDDRGSGAAARLVAPLDPPVLLDATGCWPKGTIKRLVLARADRMLGRMLDAARLKQRHAADFATFAAMERAACRADPLYWLTHYAWTHDEHDGQHPIKPFPIELPYWRPLVWAYLNIPIVALVKSRQEMATWFFCLMDLWDALFVPGSRSIFQSEKDDKAAALITRCGVCYGKQPEWLVPRAIFNTRDVRIPDHNATIMAVPKGERQVAGYTARNIFFDECNELEAVGRCIGIAKPSVRNGGRIHAVGTASPGEWERFWRGEGQED